MCCVRVAAAVAMVAAAAVLVGCQAQEGRSCVDGNRRTGSCTSIRRCGPLRQLLQAIRDKTAGPNALQILRQSVCGSQSGGELLVCCTRGAGPPGGPGPAGGRGRDLLPKRCGSIDLSDRIIDGEDAPLLAWPWMALLRGKARGQSSTWFCGGVLINDRYVLSAAHCFKIHELEFVRLGEHTLSKKEDCQLSICAPPPQDIPAEQIITHPEYNSPCLECNDIALLRLSHPVQLNPLHVVPVCLPVNAIQDMGYPEEEFQGKLAWAAGWGSTSKDPFLPRIPDKLQQALIPIREADICPRLRTGYPEPRMVLCAGGDGKDTCKGDSGGPLVLSNRGETRRYVVGITSRGPQVCGRLNTQALYTNVHYYAQWILQTLRP